MKKKIQFAVRISLSAALIYWVHVEVGSWGLTVLMALQMIGWEGQAWTNAKQIKENKFLAETMLKMTKLSDRIIDIMGMKFK